MLSSVCLDYLDRILNGSPSPRALILDSFTAQTISLIASQSSLTDRDVFFTGLVSENFHRVDDTMQMNAVVFVRPTSENVDYLVKILEKRRFRQINICKL